MSRSAVNSHMNFDNVVHAYFSLLQVASFKGWIQIIQDATDSRVRNNYHFLFLYASNENWR